MPMIEIVRIEVKLPKHNCYHHQHNMKIRRNGALGNLWYPCSLLLQREDIKIVFVAFGLYFSV